MQRLGGGYAGHLKSFTTKSQGRRIHVRPLSWGGWGWGMGWGDMIGGVSRSDKNPFWDFPSGPVVKRPPCSVGDASLIPGWENMTPHAEMQISPSAATAEPTCSGARKPQGKSPMPQIRPDTAK